VLPSDIVAVAINCTFEPVVKDAGTPVMARDVTVRGLDGLVGEPPHAIERPARMIQIFRMVAL
jgi:hypothetical protein